jgi:hypothetical protein
MRSVNGTLLMKWCASGLLVLAVSPFTAPFQAVNLGWLLSGRQNHETALVTPQTEKDTSITDDDDPGSLIGPVGRLLRLDPSFAVAVLTFVVTPLVAFLESSVASTGCLRATTSPIPLRL